MWGEVRKGFLENVASRTAIGTSKCSMNIFKRDSEYINLDEVGCHFGRCFVFVCLFLSPKKQKGAEDPTRTHSINAVPSQSTWIWAPSSLN